MTRCYSSEMGLGKTFLLSILLFTIQAREIPDWIYVGCRPTHAECVHSCGSGRALALVDPKLCDPDDFENGRLACYCPIGDFTSEQEPEVQGS